MNTKEYLKEVGETIDKLNEEEFFELLNESGLDLCPFEDDLDEKKRVQIFSEEYRQMVLRANIDDIIFEPLLKTDVTVSKTSSYETKRTYYSSGNRVNFLEMTKGWLKYGQTIKK